MLRADFTLFDQYEYTHQDRKSKFTFPITVFSAKDDGMITSTMVKGWKEETTGMPFEFVEIDGHHLFPLDKEPKAIWLTKIAKGLDGVMELIDLKAEYAGMGL